MERNQWNKLIAKRKMAVKYHKPGPCVICGHMPKMEETFEGMKNFICKNAWCGREGPQDDTVRGAARLWNWSPLLDLYTEGDEV